MASTTITAKFTRTDGSGGYTQTNSTDSQIAAVRIAAHKNGNVDGHTIYSYTAVSGSTSGTSYVNAFYVRFKHNIPVGSTINSATLKITKRNVPSGASGYNNNAVTVGVKACKNFDSGVNVRSNRPATLDTYGSLSYTYPAGYPKSNSFNVTSMVQNMLNNSSSLGLTDKFCFYVYPTNWSDQPYRIFFDSSSNKYSAEYSEMTLTIDYTSYKKCGLSISSTTPSSTTTYNRLMRVDYSANTNSDGYGSYVRYRIDGGSWTTVPDSNDNSGYFTFTPSSKGVAVGSSFTIEVQRVNKGSTSYNSDIVSKKMNTYGTISLKPSVNYNPVNANTSLTISWTGSESRYYYDGGNNSTQRTSAPSYSIVINGTAIPSQTGTSKSVKLSEYTTTSDHNKNITIKVKATYNFGSNISAVSSSDESVTTKVLYTPMTNITGLTPSSGVNYISSANITDAPNSKTITWSYPNSSHSGYDKSTYTGNISSRQNGIVTNYLVELINPNDSSVKYSTSRTVTNVSIGINNIDPNISYTLRITPRYVSGSTILNGPSYTIANYIMRVERLGKPKIIYPVTGTWYNGLSFRVGIEMPTDPTYTSSTTNYRYGDIKVKINNVEKALTNYPSAYSTTKANLVYVAQMGDKGVIFKPSLASYGTSVESAASYTISVSVKSNYIPTALSSLAWSEWSNSVVITNGGLLPTIDTTTDTIIRAVHFNPVSTIITNMAKCYKVNTNITERNRGDKILASDYVTLNNYITSLANNLNNYGYTFNNNVKFSVIQDIVTSNQIVMGSGRFDSATYNQLNYMQRALLWANEITT